MNPEEYARMLRSALRSDTPFLPGTLCDILAGEIRLMIQSYLDDAGVFSEKDDPVNWFASLTYAHGWLDAGISLGYLTGPVPEGGFWSEEMIHSSYALHEKMNRYERMLGKACTSVIPSASSGSPVFVLAEEIAGKVRAGYQKGTALHLEGRPVSALGVFSYWYGWLDTAVRCGILKITACEELFTTEI